MKQALSFAFVFGMLFSTPHVVIAELYQWIDSRGVIHFTDSLQSVPEAVRNSPQLVVRQIDLAAPWPDAPTEGEQIVLEKFESSSPFTSEPQNALAPVIHYNPQFVEVIVVHPIAHRPKGKPCLLPEGCASVFRPNPDDRRYVHPSAFNGPPQQYVEPRPFRSPGDSRK